MRPVIGVLLLGVLLGPGCGGDDTGATDAGAPSDAGASVDAADASGIPRECFVPDLACPTDRPYIGSACETDETCTYPEPRPGFERWTWTFQCVDGSWYGETECVPGPTQACPNPITRETCREPFMGTIAGATVELGPADGPFRAFTEGERVAGVIGPQGAPMFPYRLRITGDGIPSCVALEYELTIEAGPSGTTMLPQALHCGLSLTIWSTLPLCSMEATGVTIDLEALGIGTTRAVLEVTIPDC